MAKNRFKGDDIGYVGCHGKVSQVLPYPEPLRVTGPLPSLVLRAEDMWRKYNPFFIDLLIPTMQAGHGSQIIIYMYQGAILVND